MLKITDEEIKLVGAELINKAPVAIVADRMVIVSYHLDATKKACEVSMARSDGSRTFQPFTQYCILGTELKALLSPTVGQNTRQHGDFRQADLEKAIILHKPSPGNRLPSEFLEYVEDAKVPTGFSNLVD